MWLGTRTQKKRIWERSIFSTMGPTHLRPLLAALWLRCCYFSKEKINSVFFNLMVCYISHRRRALADQILLWILKWDIWVKAAFSTHSHRQTQTHTLIVFPPHVFCGQVLEWCSIRCRCVICIYRTQLPVSLQYSLLSLLPGQFVGVLHVSL